MPNWARASWASPVPCAASAALRVKRCSAMSSICSTRDALAAKRSSCKASTPTPIFVGGLADRIGCTDRAVDQRHEPADCSDPDQRAAERANSRAQQLRLAAEPLQPA
jgi:hypothetical protein